MYLPVGMLLIVKTPFSSEVFPETRVPSKSLTTMEAKGMGSWNSESITDPDISAIDSLAAQLMVETNRIVVKNNYFIFD